MTRILLDGLRIGESPRWHDGRLWYANWGEGEVCAVDLDGRAEVIARLDVRLPISIDWLPDGRLLIVPGPERRLLARAADGSQATYADLAALSEHGFNELVVDGRGNAYVNGGGFDLMGGGEFAPGLIALVTPDGAAREVAGGIAFPNGMAVTPDDSTLIVAESYARRLTAFSIAPDGSLTDRRVWADLGEGTPDGICLDAEGACWYADVPHRRCVRVREGGEVLDTVQLDRACFACMLGGERLFILAAEWLGPQRMFDGPPTGVVAVADAPAPGAGRP
jgi:sugar lactone lactonase YvrE